MMLLARTSFYVGDKNECLDAQVIIAPVYNLPRKPPRTELGSDLFAYSHEN